MQAIRSARFVLLGALIPLAAIPSAQKARAQEPPRLRDVDRIRVAEVLRLAEAVQDMIWPGWSKVPFPVLLVTPDTEFLLNHPNPPEDFRLVGEDSQLGGKIYARKRTQRTDLLATFWIDGHPTTVVGQAENTEAKASTEWIVAVMHEHFHQMQYTQPDYQQKVSGLRLARGDNTGMWMLNYRFPYAKEEVQRKFAAMCRALSEAVAAPDGKLFRERLAAYRRAQSDLTKAVGEDDKRYMEFQLWQEGLARYTQLRVAEVAAQEYEPSKEFRDLPDYKPFEEVARQLRRQTLEELTKLKLAEDKRVLFYPVGASLALMLDRAAPDWRARYFAAKFDVDGLLPK